VTVESEKKMVHFLKVHAPWDVLCYYAEDMSMRAPLQVDIPDRSSQATLNFFE
jgi:anoctamin-7